MGGRETPTKAVEFVPKGMVRGALRSHVSAGAWRLNMRHGLYRIRGEAGRSNDVRVDDDGITFPIEEAIYRARHYEPLVDDLPWQESYLNPPTP
jgi:hypothetical protein